MKRIKIFATQSQSISENVFIQNKIITPILGGAKNKKNIAQLQGDDEGDNISAQNPILGMEKYRCRLLWLLPL